MSLNTEIRKSASQEMPKLDTMDGRIRAVRKASKLTVVAVAREVGVSRVQFTKWESGTVAEPTLHALVAFTRLTHISLDWLVMRKGPDPEIIRRAVPRAPR